MVKKSKKKNTIKLAVLIQVNNQCGQIVLDENENEQVYSFISFLKKNKITVIKKENLELFINQTKKS